MVVALPSYSSTGTMASAAYERLILRGDIEVDGGCVWVENKNGERLSIRWPEGFQARFDTDAEGEATIELLDPDGVIVASGGDSIDFGGGQVDSDRLERCQVSESPPHWIGGIRRSPPG